MAKAKPARRSIFLREETNNVLTRLTNEKGESASSVVAHLILQAGGGEISRGEEMRASLTDIERHLAIIEQGAGDSQDILAELVIIREGLTSTAAAVAEQTDAIRHLASRATEQAQVQKKILAGVAYTTIINKLFAEHLATLNPALAQVTKEAAANYRATGKCGPLDEGN